MPRRRPLFPPTSIATRFCRFIQGRFAITAKSEEQGRQTKRRARSATGFSSQPICLPKTLSVLIGVGTLVIDRGRAALSGSADIVSKDPKVHEAYLGKLWEQQSLATTLEFV